MERIDEARDWRRELEGLEAAQDRNREDGRVLRRIEGDLGEFYAWSARWLGWCEDAAPTDGHSRMLLESLSSSAERAHESSGLALQEALEGNRREGLRLMGERDDLIRDRAGADAVAGEDGGAYGD